MELRQLRTFRMVAASGSFTQAAAALNYAQSNVTAQIQALEKELGHTLFNRLGRQVQLTESGQQLQRYAERLLNLADEAQAVVSGDSPSEGVLSVGAPETICTYRLPPILRQFRDLYPHVHLSFKPMLDSELYDSVRDGAIDVGFLLQEPLKSKTLVVECLIEEPLLVIGPAGHPLTQLEVVCPADLEGETILLTESGCGYRHIFEQAIAKDGIYSLVKLEFNSVEAIKQCVAAGLGIAFLPLVAIRQEIEQGQLCALNWEKSFHVYTQMVTSKERWHSPALDSFLSVSQKLLN
ncbi:MAG: LysR family transcriptional regulator [Anaerolineaceae bacterium]|nr:LysR family transcriptional regulator [Anaerolineaceae bacterium]